MDLIARLNCIFLAGRHVNKKDLLPLASIAAVIFASALAPSEAFAQNQTEAAANCPYAHVMIDGSCKLDEVRKYKIATILLDMHDEYEMSLRHEASKEGTSGAAGSGVSAGGSGEQLVSIVIAFEGYDCSLPEDLGIVDKGPCSTYYGRAQMGVLIPASSLYDAASLDHVTGIYPDADTVQLFESPVDVYPDPHVDDLGVEGRPGTLAYEDSPLHIILVGVVAVAAATTVMLRVKKRGRIEA